MTSVASAPFGVRAAFLLNLVVSSSYAFYWTLPNRDAPYQDFRKVDNATIPQLMVICDGLPQCLGFNEG